MSTNTVPHKDEIDFLYVTISCGKAREAVSGKRPLSEILGEEDPVSPQTTPEIPCSSEETIVVLGFDKALEIGRFENITCDGPIFCDPPAEILNRATVEITPTGLLYHLAEKSLDDCMMPSAATIQDGIMQTHPSERDEVWGPYYMKAFRECVGGDDDFKNS